jgi:hypothetical protein
LQEKEEEFENTRKNFQRALDSMQVIMYFFVGFDAGNNVFLVGFYSVIEIKHFIWILCR